MRSKLAETDNAHIQKRTLFVEQSIWDQIAMAVNEILDWETEPHLNFSIVTDIMAFAGCLPGVKKVFFMLCKKGSMHGRVRL